MNALLAIAESFLDRMTNPWFGSDVNEEYLMRFNQLLTEDPRFADQLANLVLEPEDIGSLPICAWPWYLQWRTERADPPSQDFLDALFEATDDPAVHMAVVMSAISDSGPGQEEESEYRPEIDTRPADSDVDLPGIGYRRLALPDDFETPGPSAAAPIQSRWLRSRATRLSFQSDSERSLSGAIEIAAQLLQISDAESVASLRDLLSIPWAGQRELRESVTRQLLDADLDLETMAQWRGQLGLDG